MTLQGASLKAINLWSKSFCFRFGWTMGATRHGWSLRDHFWNWALLATSALVSLHPVLRDRSARPQWWYSKHFRDRGESEAPSLASHMTEMKSINLWKKKKIGNVVTWVGCSDNDDTWRLDKSFCKLSLDSDRNYEKRSANQSGLATCNIHQFF